MRAAAFCKRLIKVNHREVGNLIRSETSFGMAYMTEDIMAGTLKLSPSDILTVEGEGGERYGWVDYVDLTYMGSASAKGSKKTWTYRKALRKDLTRSQ